MERMFKQQKDDINFKMMVCDNLEHQRNLNDEILKALDKLSGI